MKDPCHYLVGSRCARGLHAHRRIGPGACERCDRWAAVDASKPVPVIVRKRGDAVRVSQDAVSLCRERLAEEWSPEWQARLKAAAIALTPSRITIPAALYDEAMRHRAY